MATGFRLKQKQRSSSANEKTKSPHGFTRMSRIGTGCIRAFDSCLKVYPYDPLNPCDPCSSFALGFDFGVAGSRKPEAGLYYAGMDAEQTIADIELLEHIYSAKDTRPLTANDVAAANRHHDEKLAHSPWFRLWQHFGICCRTASPSAQLGEIDS